MLGGGGRDVKRPGVGVVAGLALLVVQAGLAQVVMS
jgi:hypothetical protein